MDYDISALYDHVVVRPWPKIGSGLACIGTVVAVGGGRALDGGTQADMQLSVNDKVVYDAEKASKALLNGSIHHLIIEDDVLAILS